MGLFAQFTYAAGNWSESGPEPWLSIDIHDSDIATIDYRPVSAPATGRCFLGFEPRNYYEDPSASAPVDRAAEAAGLAAWAATATGARVTPDDIEQMLATNEDTDPEDVFVEQTVIRLLTALGVAIPDDLTIG